MRWRMSAQRRAFRTLGILAGSIAASLAVETARAQTLDHYQCYTAKQLKNVCREDPTTRCKVDGDCPTGICLLKFDAVPGTQLTDQFGTMSLEVKKPKTLCLPVAKTPQGPLITDPNLHYERYQIKGGSKLDQLVLAVDQFGAHVIVIGKPESLLVPTTKSLSGPADPPGPGIDHYQCYKARNKKKVCTGDLATKCKSDADCATAGGICDPGFAAQDQGLVDQLGSAIVETKKIKLFCTPAEKNNENGGNGPLNPIDHLIGYQIKGPDVAQTAHTNNQFGPGLLTLGKRRLLLVPALKNPGEPCGDTFPACDGTCPNAAEECINTGTTCECQPGAAAWTQVLDVFANNGCTNSGCHGEGSSQGGLSGLDDFDEGHAELLDPVQCVGSTFAFRVLPGDPANSFLVDKVDGGPADCGSPMPLGMPTIPDRDLATIESWILGGAPKN